MCTEAARQALCQRSAAASSVPLASTQAPSASVPGALFLLQKGALVFSQSMRNSAAAKAAPRWAEAVTTSTIGSPGPAGRSDGPGARHSAASGTRPPHQARHLLFGHAGIMLQGQRRKGRAVAIIRPAQAGEGHHGPHIGPPAHQGVALGGGSNGSACTRTSKAGIAEGEG